MPVTQIILTLLVPVALCWSFISVLLFFVFHPIEERTIAGVKLQGLLPSRRRELTAAIAAHIAGSIVSASGRLISSHTIIEGLRPDIETQVDYFLSEKLKDAFPLLYQMMGEKTLAKFRIVFLEEVENTLPALMQKQRGELLSKFELEKMVVAEMNTIALADVEKALFLSGPYVNRLKLIAAGTGLMIGILQLIIELLYH